MYGTNGGFTLGILKLKYCILQDLSVDTYLNYKNKIYYLHLNNWAEPRFKGFYRLFYNEYGSSTDQFGSIKDTIVKDRVHIETTNISHENKINVIVYCLIDIFKCVNDILTKTGSNAAMYCMYYSSISNKGTYQSIIHNIGCEYILNSKMLLEASNIPPLIELGLEFNPDFKKLVSLS